VKYFAGLDVSLKETAVCVADEDGAVWREAKVSAEPAADVIPVARSQPFGAEPVRIDPAPCPVCI
jgi:hypothetical protein